MTDAELVKFTSAGAVVIVQRLKSLEPYLRELRRRFHKLKPGEQICGFKSWGEYCTKHLHKTKRALNYMLAGGNQNRPVEVLPKQKLLAAGDDLPEAKRWTAQGRTTAAAQDIEAALQILGEVSRLLDGVPQDIREEIRTLTRSVIQTLNEAGMKLNAISD